MKNARYLLSGLLLCAAWFPAQASEPEAPAGLCERIARLESRKQLGDIILKGVTGPDWVDPQDEDPRPYHVYSQHTYEVDINNDGRLEVATVRRHREQDYAEMRVATAAGDEMEFTEPDYFGEMRPMQSLAGNFEFVRSGGRIYTIAWATGSYPLREPSWLSHAFVVTPDNVSHPVCTFALKKERTTHVRAGARPICEKILRRKPDYVKFDVEFSANAPLRQVEGSMGEYFTGTHAAWLDIDNDGKKELVVRTISPAAVTHSCDRQSIEVLNAELTGVVHHPDDYRFDLRQCAGDVMEAFVLDGKTYIERSYDPAAPTPHHDVIAIENGKLNSVCDFEVRKHYYVPDEIQLITGQAFAWQFAVRPSVEPARMLEAALEKPGLGLVRQLYRREPSFGAAVADPSQASLLLFVAIHAGRNDAIEWLLSRGVDVNSSVSSGPFVTSALQELLNMQEPPNSDGVLLMLRHGAKVQPRIADLVGHATEFPARAGELMTLASRQLGYIPIEFLVYAVTKQPEILTYLVGSSLPLERRGSTWNAGQDLGIHSYIRLTELDPVVLAKYGRKISILESRRTHSTRSHSFARYRGVDSSWQFIEFVSNRTEDQEFLMFVTAFCARFLPADCGSNELVSQARAWFESLPECDVESRSKFGEACRFANFAQLAAAAGRPLNWTSWEGGKSAASKPLDSWDEIVKKYEMKDWPASR